MTRELKAGNKRSEGDRHQPDDFATITKLGNQQNKRWLGLFEIVSEGSSILAYHDAETTHSQENRKSTS